jgi:transcription-repair coupling factor (superfamily II helicase)
MNLAWTAFRIAQKAGSKDIVCLTDDEQQAERLSAAVRAIATDIVIVFVPSSDALPGDSAPASPANIGQRVAALRALRKATQAKQRQSVVCILSGEAAARRYPAPDAFDSAPPTMSVGDAISAETLAPMLEEIGYVADDRVDEPGEMALRGDVLDIYPADAQLPARVEFSEGKIGAIRTYDPVSQRTIDPLDTLEVGRANEPCLGEAVSILTHLRAGIILLSDKAEPRRQRFIALASDAAQRKNAEPDAIVEPVWKAELARWKRVDLSFADALVVPHFAEGRTPLAALARFAKPLLTDGRTLVLAGAPRDLRFLRQKVAAKLGGSMTMITAWSDLEVMPAGTLASVAMPVDAGFVDDRMVVVAAADLLGSRAMLDAPSHSAASTPWSTGTGEIRIGDVVVHEDHGIGCVQGLVPAPGTDGGASEMIALEFAGSARRLVPTDDAERIWRYGADANAVTFDKLDGSSWGKRRGAINEAVAESARGLAELARARANLTAVVIDPDSAAYERFANGFAFNETADQVRAINAVRDDLSAGRPMDRLIVGDVGYGKTEVALRAAALAALAGYQVIVAAPTTVLVRQHLETFGRRFEGTGVTVAGLSRLSSAAEKKAVKTGLADGSIDVVIGTGAVVARDVRYKSLGLVIIDEEQRFGAADKVRLRGSGETHLLALSATPIPRTLQMALVGLQQISVIATPPARRQPIRTSLDQFDDGRVRTALSREKGRGGQSFVVVPRIEDMATVSERLKRLVPELSLIEAHGKMASPDIDKAMVDFAAGTGDILLATNIIEAGLDVPRANTMIVWRADRFGLAQLHQLRGRVGRGNRRGQVILLTEKEGAIAEHTIKRLRTLAAFDQLGAGFDISAQDLDMRGAGDLLGETQAGHMKLIGADLYQHLLGSALRAARGENVESWMPELHVGDAGLLPEAWIPDEDIRLGLYVRLARIEDDVTLDAFCEELADRFGPLPDAVTVLVRRARMRVAARTARVDRLDAGPKAIAITLRREAQLDPKACGLEEKDGRFLLKEDIADGEKRFVRIMALLETVGDAATQ